ncbi:hypothetical protein [Geosporobacter subterraneus]|uniref:hypothetical protein n=1 Tax=Geosporobacter subterraneus TaxID=390806 RepID=UPI001679C094|nr:hypothetical protein [Geosporobacter subterraneus]
MTDDRQASHHTSKGQAHRLKHQDDVGQVIKQLKENSGLEKEHKRYGLRMPEALRQS